MSSQKKRYPLPKRFNIALSEQAYANLRALNDKWTLGNNYLLEVLLMNLDEITDSEKLEQVYQEFIKDWGAPGQ